MPIAAPSPTVAKIAAVRSGARRHGNFSSSPALSTTSAVMSARVALGGNVRHGDLPGADRPKPCSTSIARPSPTSGTTITASGVSPDITSIIALSTLVTPTTTSPPRSAPITAPSTEVPMLAIRDVVCALSVTSDYGRDARRAKPRACARPERRSYS